MTDNTVSSNNYQMDPKKIEQLLKSATDVQCKKCGCSIFNEGFTIKKISGLDINNPTGQDSFTNLPVIFCVNCKEVLQG